MVTFTLPYELRSLAWHNQTAVYNILFACAASTLKDFGLNPANLGAEIGMTAVLHTHSRRLDYHPHCHVIVPGGGIDKRRRQWKKVKGEDFCWLLLQHVLPKGFRRIRDYGFLHGNAKKTLKLVQLVLRVIVEIINPRPRPVLKCSHCQAPLIIIGFIRPNWQSG